MTKGKLRDRLIIGLLLLYCLSLLVYMSIHCDRFQWDFRTHREAGKIFEEGLNPYDPAVLYPRATTKLLYTYPPITLWFYWLFSLIDYNNAYQLFLFFKCLILAGLLYLWKNKFLKEAHDPLFYLFCLLAFNSAVYLDMRAGNINMFEQLMLWLGFYFYLERRPALFCSFILVAGSFKIIPIVFLGLLLISDFNKKFIYFFASVLIFLGYLLVQYIVTPDLFVGFVNNAITVLDEKGIVAPSTYNLVRDLLDFISIKLGFAVPHIIGPIIASAISLIIILVSRHAYIALKQVNPKVKEIILINFTCLVYALIHPRFKDYAYVLLLVPTYFLMRETHFPRSYVFIFILTIISFHHITLPGLNVLFGFIGEYYPLVITSMLWGLYLLVFFLSTDRDTNILNNQ